MTGSKPPEQRDVQEHRRGTAPEAKAEMSEPFPPNVHAEQTQERWYERTRYQLLLFAIGIALFVIVGALVLDWYIDPKTSTQKKDLAQALGLITAGVAGAVGIFFTWRGQRLAREAQEHNQQNTEEQLRLSQRSQEENQRTTRAQLKNTQEELRLTRQGQITERFTRAIDQLGAESLDVRLGGIYALERIARDSKRDHWPVMQVLTAYVRQHAPRQYDEASTREGSAAAEAPWPNPAADIQAIMSVIRGRTHSFGPWEPQSLDLRETNLVKVDLRGTSLRLAYLERAELKGALLMGVDLREAHLFVADLEGALLRGSDLSGAELFQANLSGADLRETIGLTDEQLEAARGDEHTQLPDYLERPESWSIWS